jgi:hypothetical protein
MLIVIPTYKRNTSLKRVLQSLIQCQTEGISEPIRVLVVNNYPLAKNEVREIVSEFVHERRFLWEVLYREKTLPPVENWYSPVLDRALPNEVVLLNADDDLFFPWSLENRFEEINRLDADLLHAQIDFGLFFCRQSSEVLYLSELPSTKRRSADLVDFGQVYDYSPQHLSNHCYRNTEHFRAGLARAMEWCHAQDWLDFDSRTLNIPLYLSYAILLSGGRVAGLPRKCVIRGVSAEEIRQAKYGVPNWNHGFIHICALGVLNNADLKDIHQLDAIRRQYSDQFVKWFPTYLVDSRVNRMVLLETLQRVHFPVSRLFSAKVLFGFGLITKDLLRLRGLRLKRRCKQDSIPIEAFLQRIAGLSTA